MSMTVNGVALRRSILGWMGAFDGRSFYIVRDGRKWEINAREGAGRAWLPLPTRFATVKAAVQSMIDGQRSGPCDWCGGSGWLVLDAFHWGPCPECLEKGKCPCCGAAMVEDICTVCDYDKQGALEEELAVLEADPFDYPDQFVRRNGQLERR